MSEGVERHRHMMEAEHEDGGEVDAMRRIPVTRHQGDGASSSPHIADIPSADKASRAPFSVSVSIDMMQVVLLLAALATRLSMLGQPRAVVFDELHYGRFSSLYMKGIFFFDQHPPLGKMLIAFAGWLCGFNGDHQLDHIGIEYPSDFPLVGFRMVPAIFGSLLVPLVYQIIVELGLSRWSATLAAVLVLFDNALLTQSRFILLEGILLFFCALTLLSLLKFKAQKERTFSRDWWLWLLCTGVSSACAFSVKYAGGLTWLLVLVVICHDMWKMLADSKVTDKQLAQHICSTVLALVFIPVIIYTSIFYIHLSILNRAGPHDDVMTSAFQASLKGGLAAITKGQPLHVAYGSQITLRHTYGRPCWLHSHAHVYPIRYRDNRGSSHQQQVTCYSFKDVNNWWIIKDPKRNTLLADDPIRPVKDGDIIQLVHGLTVRALNSHNVAAPVSPFSHEVSCYVDYNVSHAAQNLWKVEIVNKADDKAWRTIQSHVRLRHVNTSSTLKTSGKQLPDWGFYQFEVVADKVVSEEASTWNVEEHRYTRNGDEEKRSQEIRNAEMIPTDSTKLGFFSKFFELQLKMLTAQLDVQEEHRYSSSPLDWPLLDSSIAYWISPASNAQIQLLGNMMIWWSGTLAVIGYSGFLVFYLLRRRRLIFDMDEGSWENFVFIGELLVGGFLLNYLPYFLTDRTLFLYCYLPAFVFKLLLLVAFIEHLHSFCRSVAAESIFKASLSVWLTLVINTFLTFRVLSYGNTPLSEEQIKNLMWKDTWDFIIHTK